ncbi:MAG: cell division protein FtsZ [Anaerolineae bacterium]|nr:cell division protein FtsZ [Anaerolineae bacterium]NIN98274.1 cell division protein FtsZ [Anaerolineae bacterium]NIQ81203.1 cell division protein FtsZ [Anaerolineae bacterium]
MTPQHYQPLIKVIGIGGGGSNAIDRMIHVGIPGVQFLAANTDAQALALSEAPRKVQLGPKTTRGLGAGGNPEVGAKAAKESAEAVRQSLSGAEIVFLALGLGGGTGTGAGPVIAELARESGALTIAVATTPFSFEGRRRSETAQEGMEALAVKSDTLVAISNDRLLEFIDEETSLDISFRIADEVLRQGIQGVAELITSTGVINLNLMHVRTILQDAGPALMSIGQGRGDDRAIEAAELAIASPLSELSSIAGASGILVNITGGNDLSLDEIQQAVSTVAGVASPEANIFFGATVDPGMGRQLQVMLIAVGMDGLRSAPSALSLPVGDRRSFYRRPPSTPRAATGKESLEFDRSRQGVDLLDLDVPTFLRRRRLARVGEEGEEKHA